MASPGPLRLPSPGGLAELIGCDPALLDLTLDQLRTLLVVHETGSALRAARTLGREQSSVQKQLDTLNRSFQRLCGELLVVKRGRGQDFLFTPTGQAAVELARSTFTAWLARINDCRRKFGRDAGCGDDRVHPRLSWTHLGTCRRRAHPTRSRAESPACADERLLDHARQQTG